MTITTTRGLEKARKAAVIYVWLGVVLMAIGVTLAILTAGSTGGVFGGVAAIGLVALTFGLRGRRWVSNQRALRSDDEANGARPSSASSD
jgi:hypothetical protein